VIVGVAVAAVAIAAAYVRWQAFDDETFDGTASELIDNETIRAEVAAVAVDRLFANVDVQRELADRLPSDQQRLAGPIAAGLRELADQIAVEMLARPRVQALWRESVSESHDQLVALLRGRPLAVDVPGAAVVLDLRPVILQLGERLSITTDLTELLPEDAGVVRIVDAHQLERARDLTSRFETVARWIWVVPFVLWAIALWLAVGRRRLELRAIALGLTIAGILVLVARSLAGTYVVDELASGTTHDAADDAWTTVTALLADGAWAVIAAGVLALVGLWLAGDTTSGAAARRLLAPVLARPDATYGTVAALFLLFVWWGPFAQARRPLYLCVTAVLLGAGVEALRRITARQFPGARPLEPRELLSRLERLRVAGWPPREGLADQLERFGRLHERGVLTDDEFAAAKTKLLEG
jgi:hypothetical protein